LHMLSSVEIQHMNSYKLIVEHMDTVVFLCDYKGAPCA
jgi:hypothetical protein